MWGLRKVLMGREPGGVRRWRGVAGAMLLGGMLSACAPLGAPSLSMFGAYFPSWLACAVAGILGAVVLRFVFIRLGIDDALPTRLPIYIALAAGLGFLVSLLSFGR